MIFKFLQELYWDCWIYFCERKLIFRWNNNEFIWRKKNLVGLYWSCNQDDCHALFHSTDSAIFLPISAKWSFNLLAMSSEVRTLMDNIILNYIFYNIFYLTIFCVNDVIDDAPSLLYIVFSSIEFMFIIIIFWSSNLAGDNISEMSIKIFMNFILTVEYKIML